MREIIGIGNDLFGDDGFGPRVVEYIMNNYSLPADVKVINAGSSPDFLLDELVSTETKMIVVVDVLDSGKKPGEITVIKAEDLPNVFPQRFTHFIPIADLLKEIHKTRKIDIRIIACQPENITVPNVCVGLTKSVSEAVPKAADIAIKIINQNN